VWKKLTNSLYTGMMSERTSFHLPNYTYKGECKMSNKETMVESLHKGVCQVTFEKTDGSKRVMNCTLNSSYLPQNLNEESETKESNPNVIPVWDIDANSWRSFRIDSVEEFQTGSFLGG